MFLEGIWQSLASQLAGQILVSTWQPMGGALFNFASGWSLDGNNRARAGPDNISFHRNEIVY
jgi:hypothetical protein